jgi:cysteine desulfurase NifS
MSVKEKKGICGICSAGCWIIAEYDDQDRIVKVRPDDGTPMGILCKIGEHAPEIIYSENRLKHPLLRKGPKGTYDFKPISWDDAYSIIVEKFEQIKKTHGPEATAIYTGVGSFELGFCDIYQPKDVAVSSASSVLFPFGSPNTMGVGALCYVSYGMIAPHLTMGKMLIDMFNDIENSELIVVWGTNPATDLPPIEMKRIMEAKTRGARVVVIDPRKTATAKLTDAQWVPIRPGTDGALALGLCNVLIQEELYDEKFVKEWTRGFEAFADYVQHFRPEVVERITGIPGSILIDLARDIEEANGAAKLMYTGMEYSQTGVQGIRASFVLWALAGQLDVPGGLCFFMPDDKFPINRDGHIPNPGEIGSRIGGDRFPVYIKYRDEAHAIALPESVLNGKPYPIQSLIILGGSILTSWPNPLLWKKTLNALDFLVCIDRQFTADAAYADIVLPAATYFEIESYMVYGSLFRIREKMIDPVGEARSDVFILSELAKRLGYGARYPQNADELLRHVLKGSGYTLDGVKAAGGMASIETRMMEYKKWHSGLLRKDGKPGFDTPSGKFEISSSILEEYGYNPLPEYTEPKESPESRLDLIERFPLVFNSGSRARTGFHTQHHGIKGLSKKRPEPTVTLNQIDAENRNIETGDMVVISTPRGSATMRALVTEDIVQGAIDANHACGSPIGPKAWKNLNINELTDMDQYDPISGFPVYKALLCDVQKKHSDVSVTVVNTDEMTQDELNYNTYEAPSRVVYLDNNATTPMRKQVKEYLVSLLDAFGNPSSIHESGRQAKSIVESSRRQIARALHTTPRRIVFTGSGSEANNLAIKGATHALNKTGRIITSSIEHPSVLNACRWLASIHYDVVYAPVDAEGILQPDTLEKLINEDTVLVSIMLANNETGVLQPIQSLAKIARQYDALFHCDAVQGFGKIKVDVNDLDVDLLTISSHKVYGPKGVGALYLKHDDAIVPLINGGGHERGFRAGTENVLGVAGFGKAAEFISQSLKQSKMLETLRDRLEHGIAAIFPDYRLNGHREQRLPNTLNVTLPGYRGESVVLNMDRSGVQCSSGSACKSGSEKPSHALLAMNLSEEEAHCALRFSLGLDTSEKDIAYTIDLLTKMVSRSKNMVRFVPCR